MVALLDTLGVARAHVVGLSLGGMTGMRLAARNPERVDRLVVLCTGAKLDPVQRLARPGRDRARATGPRPSPRRWSSAGSPPPYLEANPDVRAASEAVVAATPAEGYASCCEVIAAMDLRADLPRIAAPTLAIAGADDPATPPPHLEAIADAVQDGRLLVVPDAAHLANAEQPQTITPAIIEHLRGGAA